MDARARTVSEILHESAHYLVPLFQRSYSWHKEHWQRLNDDIMALADDNDRMVHFLGPLVCTVGKSVPGSLPTYQLIDGQQRLTTLTVVLSAIRDVARDRGLVELADEITEDYLIHKRKQDLERFKVLPRVGDREALHAIVEEKSLAPFGPLRLVHALKFFRRQVLHRARKNPRETLQHLYDTVTRRLSLVVITIDGENPYEIFESLNATGLPLAESDLIRNHIFMQIPIADQDAFDRAHWQPLERYFDAWGEARPMVMTGFYRDYLMRNGEYAREKSTFVGFKDQQKERGLDASAQTAELKHYAPLAVQIRKPETCPTPAIARRLTEVDAMDIGTANALVLHLLDRHARGTLPEDGLCECLRDLVSFVLRRTICGESTRGYSRWFIEAIEEAGDQPVENLRKYWLERGWPDDAAFARALADFEIYKREPRKTKMLLDALELGARHKEQVDLNALTIEHVMPQTITNDKAGQAWRAALGEAADDLHERYLHVLGNLTLTGYNPELGKMAFGDKQAVYRDSHVGLNRYFHDLTAWNADAIRERTEKLAGALCAIWPRPADGQAYEGEAASLSEEQQASPAKRRNLEYWGALIKRWDKQIGLLPPVASDSNEMHILLDQEKGVTIGLWQYRRENRVALFVRFEGRSGRALYLRLQEIAKEIEDQVDGEVTWDWPYRNSFSLTEEDVDFSDRNDWEIQHGWFLDTLADLVAVLKPEIAREVEEDAEDMAKGEEELTECQQLRLKFWGALLPYAATKTPLHAQRKPSRFSWTSCSIGRRGFSLNYAVRENAAKVELYIDLGKGCEEENKRAFGALLRDKEAIETLFGSSLEWQELPGSRACRISKEIKGGWRSSPEEWPNVHATMVDAMIRLDRALRPYVQGLRL